MKIKTKNLTLRELKDSDDKAYVEIFNDAEISKYLGETRYPFTEEDAKKKLEFKSDKNNIILGIEHNGKLIGNVMLTQINNLQKNAFMHYAISKKYQRKGFGFEATKTLLDYGINKLGLKSIESGAFKENVASRKLLEKLGFIQGYIIEKHKKAISTGKIHDFVTYKFNA